MNFDKILQFLYGDTALHFYRVSDMNVMRSIILSLLSFSFLFLMLITFSYYYERKHLKTFWRFLFDRFNRFTILFIFLLTMIFTFINIDTARVLKSDVLASYYYQSLSDNQKEYLTSRLNDKDVHCSKEALDPRENLYVCIGALKEMINQTDSVK
jgi:hypothetical protein